MINGLRLHITWVILLLAFQAGAQISVDAPSGCTPHLSAFSLGQTYSTYSWSFSDGSQSSAAAPVIIFDDPGNYSVTVTVTSSAGSQTFTGNNLVQVYASPDPQFNVVNDTVCHGQQIQGSIVQPTASSTYQWTMGDGTTYATQQINHNYQNAGTYQIQLNETNAGGCLATSDVQWIQVRSQPNSAFSLSDIKACHDSVVITATASNQNNTCEWSLNGNYVSTGGTHSFSNLPIGQHTITLNVTDAYGCENEYNRSVKKSNPPSFTTWNSGLQGCAPYNFMLSVPQGTGAQVTWSAGGNNYAGDSAQILFDIPGQYTVIQTITDSLTCSYTDTISGIEVQQTALPAVTLGDTSLCHDGWAVFQVDDTTVQSVVWSIGDSTRFGFHDSIMLSTPGAHDLIAAFTLTNGCTVNRVVDDAFFIETALPMVSLEPDVACVSAEFITRHNNPFIGVPTWTLAGQVRVGDTTHFTVDSIGVFDMVFIASTSSGCSDTTVFSNILTVKGDSVVTASPTVYDVCDPLALNLDGGLYGVEQFSWDLGDGSFSSDSHLVHLYDEVGSYLISLEAINAQGCTVKVDSHSIIDYGEMNPEYGFELVNCPNAEVLFYSLTNGASWIWEIDGDTFTDSSFIAAVNPYAPVNVKHIVTNDAGCSGMLLDVNALHLDSCITSYIGDFPAPGQTGGSGHWYSVQPYVNACAPVEVGFDHPEDSLSLVIYDFGNGDTVHATSKITHLYDSAGYYDIHLSLIDLNGDTTYRLLDDYVRIGKPEAGFDISSVKGCFGTEVALNNTSEYASIWLTSFGDGGTSTAQHPAHVYTQSGDFTIHMLAKDTFNCKSHANQDVSVLSGDYTLEVPLHVCAGDTFYFDHDIKGYEAYEWHLDTFSFVGREPVMVLPAAGVYGISLTATDTNGCDLIFFDDKTMEVFGPEVEIDLGIDPDQCFTVDHDLNAIHSNAPNLSWYVNGVFLGNQSSFEFHGDTAGLYAIELQGWQNGCQASDRDTINVHAPSADFTINNNGLCLPQNVLFTDASSPAVSWAWNFGDGANSNAQNPIHGFDYGLKDSITLSITDSFGCVSTIKKAPVGFHEVDVKINKRTFCAPDQVVVWDEVGDGQVYDWSLNGMVSSLGDSVAFNMNDSGFLSLGLAVVFNSGCTATINLDSLAFMARPVADFGVASISGECAPKTVSFEDRSSTGIVTFDWDFGNDMRSNLPNPTAVYSESGDYDVSLRIKDSLGCRDTIVYPGLVQIEGPKAKFRPDKDEICAGERVAFLNQSVDAVSYLWIFGDGNSSTRERGRNQYADSGSYTVDLFAFDSTGCRDRERYEYITVNLGPDPSVALRQRGTCTPSTFVLEDYSTGLIDPDYSIFFGEDRMGVEPDTPFVYTVPGDHEVKVLIENVNGCSARKTLKRVFQVFDTVAGPVPVLRQLGVQNEYTLLTAELDLQHNFKELVLLKERGNQWDTIDTRVDSSYAFKDDLPEADASSCYRMGMIHHCVEPTQLDSLPVFCTVHLDVSQESEAVRHLTWNAINAEVEIEGYEIQTRREGQGYSPIAQVGPGELGLIDSNLYCPGEQAYRVVALAINGFEDGQSNRVSIELDTLPVLLNDIDVQHVSVIEDESILVEWDPLEAVFSPLVPGYILRRTAEDQVFQELPIDVRHGIYIDHKVDVGRDVYTYEVVPVNSCGLNLGIGEQGASLLLLEEQHGNEVELKWRGNEELMQDVEYFEVQYQDPYGIWKTLEVHDKDQRSTIIDLRSIEDERD
jgi:PKD repeat protein